MNWVIIKIDPIEIAVFSVLVLFLIVYLIACAIDAVKLKLLSMRKKGSQ